MVDLTRGMVYPICRIRPILLRARGDALDGTRLSKSYSTCYIVTTDVDALYDAFRSGLRAALGKLPTRGLPASGR
jgi:hypothetical protein